MREYMNFYISHVGIKVMIIFNNKIMWCYRQAAEHLLIALNQQASGRDTEGKAVASEVNMSRTIWSTLRLVIALMDKVHLMESVENR